jgi:hypothetical protein
MKGRIALSLAVVAVTVMMGAVWVTDRPQRTQPRDLVVDFTSTVGEDRTEGEATAWNNAQKLAVDGQGGLHLAYQVSYGKVLRGGEDRIRYARSPDGRRWTDVDEWSGRYPTLAVDRQDRVYIAYVGRTDDGDRLRLRRYDPALDAWEELVIAEAPRRSFAYPALAPGPSALHLAWESHTAEGHALRYVEIPLNRNFTPGALLSIDIETVAQNERGIYFAALAIDPKGRVFMAWEAALDARYHRIDGAVRRGASWETFSDLSRGAPDARSPALGPAPGGGVRLVYLVREGDRRRSLYVASFSDQWGRPELLVREDPDPTEPSYSQLLLAFPVVWGEYALWGHSVPDACGAGPLSWTALGSEPRPLIGAFASYPHITEGPEGVWHLVWTDRDESELRAFVVRYARLKPAE